MNRDQHSTQETTTDPNLQRAHAGRRDLSESFGLVLTMPPGTADVRGKWWYGIWGAPSAAKGDPPKSFEEDMRQLVRESQHPLTESGIIDQASVELLKGEYYQIGPASESWPSFLFDIYKHARPFVGDGADLLAWGYFFRSVLEHLAAWASDKNQSWPHDDSVRVQNLRDESISSLPKWEPVKLTPVLTRMALVSLCFQHAVERYGLGGGVAIDTFPRGWYYGDVEHPQGWENYLIRIVAGERYFYYQVTASGLVQQHFLLTGADVTLMELPDFGSPEYRDGYRALPAERVEVSIS